MTYKKDIRDHIFAKVRGNKYKAQISAQGDGILSGIEFLERTCKKLGIGLKTCKKNGARVKISEIVATLEGNAKQMVLGEEELIGWVSKASGIATAAWKAKRSVGKGQKVVCGAWKKMPLPVKGLVRQAITDGGIQYHIAEKPFLYMDKNYIKILGGIGNTLQSVRNLKGHTLVIQLKGKPKDLVRAAILSAKKRCDIIMIDTGKKDDIKRIDSELRAKGLRSGVQIAFSGNIGIEDLGKLKKMPVEIIDIGRAIVDAPLLDMRMDVTARLIG
jgi:nicotinate-nucleotide pyrophosphorylase (carboxylating)